MKNILYGLSFLLFFPSSAVFSQKLAPTENDAKLNVFVISEKKKPQEGETVMFESFLTKKVYSGITKTDGKFEILVPKGDKYKVKYKAFTSNTDYTTLDVPKVKGELLEFDVEIQFELPKQYTLDNVYFETGKATINPKSFKELDELTEFMKLKKTLVLEIGGHTDNVGNPEANLRLSQDRANSAREYLVKKGIDGNRVKAKGYGDTKPIASNETNADRQKNRRTEVRIIKE